MTQKYFSFIIYLLISIEVKSQIDPSLLKFSPKSDSSLAKLNMDAIYSRPLLDMGKIPVSIGGYVESNWQHLGTDGVSEGHQFQFRRLTLFVASSIANNIKFLSEIEFEPAEKEIGIEFAAIDIEFHPFLNLRSGMIVNPIGAFNQNHDGPKWEFTDRPLSATTLLPATWSNVGVGIYGKKYKHNWMFGYELYATSGFDNSIIDNDQNKTYLPAAKNNTERFEELPSGTPLYTAKIAARHTKVGEVGISYMGGIFNKWQNDGIVIDEKRKLNVWAIDLNTTISNLNTFITGEWSWVKVDVPGNYSQQYGNKQYGGFIDIVQPIVKRKIFNWNKATINLALRAEYVDWNVGKFEEDNKIIGEHLWSIVPAISFRPSNETVFRLNYRFQRQIDILGNPPSNTGGFSIGVSSYF